MTDKEEEDSTDKAIERHSAQDLREHTPDIVSETANDPVSCAVPSLFQSLVSQCKHFQHCYWVAPKLKWRPLSSLDIHTHPWTIGEIKHVDPLVNPT